MFLFLDFYRCAKFHKTLTQRFREKLVIDVRTCGQASIHKISPAGGPKTTKQIRIFKKKHKEIPNSWGAHLKIDFGMGALIPKLIGKTIIEIALLNDFTIND